MFDREIVPKLTAVAAAAFGGDYDPIRMATLLVDAADEITLRDQVLEIFGTCVEEESSVTALFIGLTLREQDLLHAYFGWTAEFDQAEPYYSDEEIEALLDEDGDELFV